VNSTPSRSLIQLGHILESSPKQPTPDRLSQPNRTVFQALISPSNLDGCFNMVDTLSFTSGYVKSSMTFIRVEQNQLAPSPAVVRLSSGCRPAVVRDVRRTQRCRCAAFHSDFHPLRSKDHWHIGSTRIEKPIFPSKLCYRHGVRVESYRYPPSTFAPAGTALGTSPADYRI